MRRLFGCPGICGLKLMWLVEMAENTLVINNRELVYKGIFRSEEVFQTINRVLFEKGYSYSEKRSEEINTEEGRKFYVELRPVKVKTMYLRLEMRMRVTFDAVTSVVEEKVGTKTRFDLGDVSILFDGWVKTDYQDRWTQNPYSYFLKGWINKYVYKLKLDDAYATEIFSDTAYMYGKLRALFDSYVVKEKKVVRESDVIASMDREFAEFREQKDRLPERELGSK